MAEIYQMAISGLTPQGNYWATIWHWLWTPTDPLVGISAAREVSTWFDLTGGAAYQAVLPLDTKIANCSVRRVSLGGGPTWSDPFNELGVRTGTVQSAGVCPDVAWYPGEEPWNIGHTYLPGVTSDDLDEGIYDPGFVTAVQTWIDLMTSDTNITQDGSGLQFVLWNAATDEFAIVITGTLKPKPTLMNRRLKPVTT
jgi:hypothetical protein